MFTNVRLLPCLLKDAAGRQVTALTEAIAPAVAAASATPAGGTRGMPAVDAAVVMDEHAESRLHHVVGELSEGFGRATREATGESDDPLSDTRLVAQLGMLLGSSTWRF